MLELVIIRGLPESGKSALARRICEETGAAHVEVGMFWRGGFDLRFVRQAHEWCRSEVCRQLFWGRNVVLSNTLFTQREIDPYLAIAKHAGATVSCITLTGGIEHERIKGKFVYNVEAGEGGNVRIVGPA